MQKLLFMLVARDDESQVNLLRDRDPNPPQHVSCPQQCASAPARRRAGRAWR